MAGKRRAHGEGTIRQRPDGRWEARIAVGYNPNGTRRRKSVYGKTQAEVRRELNKLASKRDAGEVIATTRAAKLVDFLSAWLEAGAPTARGRKDSLNERSLESYVLHIRVHIVPGLGDIRLEALTSPMIHKWVNALPVGSAENICRTLSMALNYAVKQKIIVMNPASGLSIPNSGDDKELHKPLDSEEAKRFLKAAEGHRLWALWVLLLGLGMREGEALGVRRRDVDFKQNTVRIWQGKTQRSRRTLSMPLFVMSALREHIAIGPFGVAMIDGPKLNGAVRSEWTRTSSDLLWTSCRRAAGRRAHPLTCDQLPSMSATRAGSESPMPAAPRRSSICGITSTAGPPATDARNFVAVSNESSMPAPL